MSRPHRPRFVVQVAALCMAGYLVLASTIVHMVAQMTAECGGQVMMTDIGNGDSHQHKLFRRFSYNDKNHRGESHLTGTGTSNHGQKTKRQLFEERYPPNDESRIRQNVSKLRTTTNPTTRHPEDLHYDIENCPSTPPTNYPVEWNLVSILKAWNPDRTVVPDQIYNGLCTFDWDTEYDKIRTYREAELPFVVRNQPELLRATERWNTPGYLRDVIGGTTKQLTERSDTNKLIFWRKRPGDPTPRSWKPPTQMIQMDFDAFVERATAMERGTSTTATVPEEEQVNLPHYYFRLKGNLLPESNKWMYDEMPIFYPDPSKPDPIFMAQPDANNGINGRFGMFFHLCLVIPTAQRFYGSS